MSLERLGLVLVICAPSGAGKSTLIRRLREEFPAFSFSVSCTTRAPREGERNGVDYHFLSREAFLERKDAGYFAEWAEVHGNYYGTPLEPVRAMLHDGRDVLFDIDVQGARQLRESFPEGLFVFVLPPSRIELESRLRGRGTDSEESIVRRLDNAYAELEAAREFDYWVVNDDLDRAYADLRAVYMAGCLRRSRQPLLVQSILGTWK